jgi:hypothetical protein
MHLKKAVIHLKIENSGSIVNSQHIRVKPWYQNGILIDSDAENIVISNCIIEGCPWHKIFSWLFKPTVETI